jgi:hypothetical protein
LDFKEHIGLHHGRRMKLLTQYLNHALTFESLAATEPSLKLKAALAKQARAYRKLAAERAAKLGLPQPSEPVISKPELPSDDRTTK